MSIDRSKPISVKAGDPIFLSVKAGMTVIMSDTCPKWDESRKKTPGGWQMSFMWMEVQETRRSQPLFQVADVDDGTVRWVNADLVSHIVPRV